MSKPVPVSADPLAGRLAVRPGELPALIGVSRSTAFALVRSGEIPSRKVGRRGRLIAVDALRSWLAAKR